MNNLRDKLNSVPQEIDQEKIWKNIQAGKKKRRRFGWLWLLPLLLLGLVFYFSTEIFNTNGNTPTHVASTHLQDQESSGKVESKLGLQKKATPVIKIPIQTTQNKTSINRSKITISTNAKSTPNTINLKSLGQDNSFTATTRPSNKLNTRITTKSKTQHSSTKIAFAANIDSGNTTTNTASAGTLTAKETEPSSKHLTDEKATSSVNDTAQPNSSPSQQISIDLLPYLNTELITNKYQYLPSLQQVDIEKSSQATIVLPYYISAGIGIGMDNTNFQRVERTDEKPLETLCAHLELEKQLTPRLSIAAMASHSIASTKINYVENFQAIELDNSTLVNNEYLTKYNLYNQYHRSDISLALKYKIPIGNLLLLPSIGYGLNIYSSASGNVRLDQNLQPLTFLDYADRSGGFASLGLGIQYQINKKYALGLSANVQTTRNIIKPEGHSITPTYLNIYFKKAFVSK